MKQQSVSIVIPTLNEAENIPLLLERIDSSMHSTGADYEVVVVDDHSSDSTVATAIGLANRFPVRVTLKQGKRGKAYSLLEGFDQARYPLTAMIDADLQYPPEELATMYHLLIEKNADVVITERHEKKTSLLRKLSTRVYNFLFARLLFGIKYDTQSGLKLFKSNVLSGISMDPSPWTFDLEFLVRAFENKRKIISHAIPFNERNAGVTKIKLFSATIEMATASLKLRWRTSHRKTREGYRANNRFLKRAFGTFAVALCVLNFSAVFTPKSSAAALPIGGILHSLKDFLSPGVSQLSASGQNPTQSTATQPQTAQSSPVVTQPQATLNDAPATTSGRAATVAASTAPASNDQSGKLGAATATRKLASIYDDGYPNYKLSSSTAHKWSRVATVILEIGLGCLALAALAIALRAKRTHTYFKNLRS